MKFGIEHTNNANNSCKLILNLEAHFVVGNLLALSLNLFINSLSGNKVSTKGVEALRDAEIWSR